MTSPAGPPPPPPPDRQAPAAPTPERGRGRLGRRLRALPLSARMVVIVVGLLLVGLSIAGVATTTLLRGYLTGQLDHRLVSTGESVANGFLGNWTGGVWETVLPSDYYIEFRELGGGVQNRYDRRSMSASGLPEIPPLDVDDVREAGDEPYTVSAARSAPLALGSPPEWRAISLLVYGRDQEVAGTITVALPMAEIDSTVRQIGRVLWLSAGAIVLLGAVVGLYAVRRALRPLREIEQSAALIAAGDLSHRVPTPPESTEVGSLARSLNAMLNQIEKAFASRTESESRMRRFVSDASHELRTPLVTIRGYSELYRLGAVGSPDQLADVMRRIEGSATQMGGLVEDLLALARLDEGRPEREEPVDLRALAADAASDLRALDPSRPVRLVLDGRDVNLHPGAGAPDPRFVVRGDAGRLRQVLANLVGNAARHTPSGTPVEISLQAPLETSEAVLEVRDHGPGIPAEHADRVFERFHRVDSSRNSASGGSGLGLAIVAAIVTAHGGRAQALPTPGGGATLRVVLPRETRATME